MPNPSRRTIAGRSLAIAVVAATLVLLIPAQPAQAWLQSASVDVPARFVFSGDVRGIARPTGFKVGITTDWNVGLAFERYAVPVDDPQAGIGGVQTEAAYRFLDLTFALRFNVMHLALGFGSGTVELEPFQVGGTTLSTDGGTARQVLVVLGWPLGPTWEFHVGYHEIAAEADLVANQVPTGSTLGLDGVMHSLGLKYTF